MYCDVFRSQVHIGASEPDGAVWRISRVQCASAPPGELHDNATLRLVIKCLPQMVVVKNN